VLVESKLSDREPVKEDAKVAQVGAVCGHSLTLA